MISALRKSHQEYYLSELCELEGRGREIMTILLKKISRFCTLVVQRDSSFLWRRGLPEHGIFQGRIGQMLFCRSGSLSTGKTILLCNLCGLCERKICSIWLRPRCDLSDSSESEERVVKFSGTGKRVPATRYFPWKPFSRFF